MNASMRNQHPRHRIDVDRYYAMVPEGLLAPDARVELIDGEIIEMPPIGMSHGEIVDRLNHRFCKRLGELVRVRVRGSVRLDRFSQPQPDLALLAARKGYGQRHPHPEDVLLLIEVSDSSLRFDCDIKLPLYARHGIPEVWIVDINGGLVHFFRSPHEGRFTESSSSATPGKVSLATLPGGEVDLTGLFDL
jgi:Uma2 family endonuclease